MRIRIFKKSLGILKQWAPVPCLQLFQKHLNISKRMIVTNAKQRSRWKRLDDSPFPLGIDSQRSKTKSRWPRQPTNKLFQNCVPWCSNVSQTRSSDVCP